MENNIFKKKISILDGGMGTELQKRGLKPGERPDLLNLTAPEIPEAVHRSYIEAGADIIYSNTFITNGLKLPKLGYSASEVAQAGVKIAKKAAEGTDTLVAIDIGPLGELIEPMGSLTFEQAYELFKEVAVAGEKAGADLAVIETMSDLYEIKAALLAVKENTELPVITTMSVEASGRTFTGCTLESMARTLEALGSDALGLNCSVGPDIMAPMIKTLAENTRLPIVAKSNAGLPDPVTGQYDMDPEKFAECVAECIKAGATIVGGCCGTNPLYIKKLSETVRNIEPERPEYRETAFVCTATDPVFIDGVRVIGERINPTGKKRFQQALLENDLDYILDIAIQEEEAGAEILDVNVGFPGVNEVEMLPAVVKKIQSAVSIPLQLDSSNPEALSAGLRVYNGIPAVNSVNASEKSLKSILPLIKKYGACVVGLTLDESGIPDSAEKRIKMAETILSEALQYGIPRQNLWIDCLTLTVSAQQEQAMETLKAVRYISEQMGLKTVLGVSNISFGLPLRNMVTKTFLVQALSNGLSLPIINPNSEELMDIIFAHRVLSGEDSESRRYIERFSDVKPELNTAKPGAELSLKDAIIKGLRSEAGKLAKAVLESESEISLVENHLIPALDKVGEDYESGKAFLPQLMSSAQAAQAAFEEIKKSLLSKGGADVKAGKVVVATVKGDIHDIGKNIVKTVLENYGYDVIDLGRDVAPEIIAETVKAENIKVVGLSALMTTTLPAMEETIALLRGMDEPPVIFVGGAVLTPEYAENMGADYFTKDARQSVEVARKVLA